MSVTRKHRGKSGLQPAVLLVEPRAEELEKTRALLGEAGFRVVPLTRFEAVVPIFEVIRPDAVVLAVHPPDFAAVAVVRRLRQLGEATVPLFYLMDPDQPEAWRFCLEKGLGVDMVPRTLSGSELALRLQSVLRLRDAVLRAKESGETGQGSVLHDELTGVYNKQFLLALIGQEARRSERYGGPFSVMACAPQGFRAFCKQHGEAMGQRLLVYTAVVLGQTVRESDVVARVSDEEFALLLPAMEEDALPGLLARIATRFELARFQVEGKPVKTSLLLGAVSFPDMVGTPAQLLNGAIQEMRRSREVRRWDVGMSRVSV
ncbi:GGDEF domain-containing protein [Stigmatella erecta]|uniref:Diguanylate cyclase (GGDEF) domain-containing protein n=1 Tax=Stigmatella erecta TaxID=83460 RepID=A0A1I0K732_9BACT|nr:diguanylate cyclase [Stigmatella erecta]SEU19808.1 diguanylate cyclase (GGDEF) domain-containing protein [Stigmatella erecta]